VKGKVVSITDYGAFIELEPGVEGLVHVSEMSWTKRVKHPKKMLNVGDESSARCSRSTPRPSASRSPSRSSSPNPWTLFVSEFNPVGDKVIRGKVRSITDYGIFIGIRDGVDGMVHKSATCRGPRASSNPSDLFQKNDDVEAVILSINHDEKKVSLGIKQLFDDPWSRIPNDYPPGQAGRGQDHQHLRGRRHTSISSPGIDGFIPVARLRPTSRTGRQASSSAATPSARRLASTSSDKRILLSMRGGSARTATDRDRRDRPGSRAHERWLSEPSPPKESRRGSTLGDLIKEKLGDLGDLPSKG
jgi:small subunit ribosomal protein S1